MNCPNCNEILVMTDRQGIEIDYCPKCRGVWLDKGELDKIIDRSASMAPPQTPPRPDPGQSVPYRKYDDDYEGKGYDPRYKKKKGGFLGDLFDF